MGGSLLTGRNSRVFQKEAKSEGHSQNHAVRGTAGRVRSSCVKNMQQGQGTREKRILYPKLKSASLWLEHVLLGGTWLEGSLWNHGAGEGVRKVPRTTYNTQVPPQFKNNC